MDFSNRKKLLIIPLLIIIGLPAMPASAAMRSDSYILYENVHHTFDGPVISNVSASVSGQTVTVSWETDITADSFVIYSEDSGFASSFEQGSSVKDSTAHSVELSGLAANTVYYYRVRSERINGGLSTDTTQRTFTTGSDAPTTPTTPTAPTAGGGGILIIDKTDKLAPEIGNIVVSEVGPSGFTVSWETDEESTSFVEYGLDAGYGNVYGLWSTSTEHRVVLDGLLPATEYDFRVLSSDSWGNIGYSENQSAVTLTLEGEEPTEEELAEEPAEEPPEELNRQIIDFITRLFPQISLNDLSAIDNLDDLSDFIATPIISGEPSMEVGADEATIRWQTDVAANSLVAISPESDYDPEAEEPYRQIVGRADEYVSDHEITLYGLTPDTTYHFQLRSAARLGPSARSRDFTFRTSIEELQILSYLTQINSNESATFKWTTNKEADSAVVFTPYYNNELAVDQQKTIRNNSVSVVHELTVDEFVAGTYYEIELVSTDDRGNEARKILSQFSTTEDDLPPVISHIKADSTVFVDRSDKIQTIISWLTNEPATSQVHYQEGVHGGTAEFSESTGEKSNYTKEHVVLISKFKPGIVYSFRVQSMDSGGNVAKSKVHTFMTAKKKESIITIIMNILENTFGWVKQLM